MDSGRGTTTLRKCSHKLFTERSQHFMLTCELESFSSSSKFQAQAVLTIFAIVSWRLVGWSKNFTETPWLADHIQSKIYCDLIWQFVVICMKSAIALFNFAAKSLSAWSYNISSNNLTDLASLLALQLACLMTLLCRSNHILLHAKLPTIGMHARIRN